MSVTGPPEGSSWKSLDDCTASLAGKFPDLEKIRDAAPPAGFTIGGRKIPRQAHRASGRTSVYANIDVHEPKPPDDPDSPLTFSMEGYEGEPPAPLIARFWAPGWNSVQAVNKFQAEVGGSLHGGDPGVRLIEPPKAAKADYFLDIPQPFELKPTFLALPLYHIFGSEEMSMLSPTIAERAPKPYVALNPQDATLLHVSEGEAVEVSLLNKQWLLPVAIKTELPAGTAGFPAGLPQLKGITHGLYLNIKKVPS
jgi:NADH-quinone oxidoreductase subunit G